MKNLNRLIPHSLWKLLAAQFALTCFTSGGASAAAPLVASQPISIPNSHGGFDFIEVDQQSSRLLAPHTKNGTFDVFDSTNGQLLKQCAVGATQSVAVNDKAGKYYIAGSSKARLITIDSKALEITGETPLSGPADIATFDPKNHLAYVCHDDGTEVWAVDVALNKVVASITIPEGPEGIVYDEVSDRVFVNVKQTSEVVVIDPAANKVVAQWSTKPAESPHGLALDSKMHRLFAVGANGQLVAIDLKTGKIVGSANVAPKVDQIAYDPELKRIYCASGFGVMSVVQVTDEGLTALGDAPTHVGAHSVAVESKTHTVWTAYGDGDGSYILNLKVPQ